jgi:hypothetical protein
LIAKAPRRAARSRWAAALLIFACHAPPLQAETQWRPIPIAAAGATLAERIPPPDGFVRAPAVPGSWAEWLRALPLEPAGSPVLLFDGRPKARQDVQAAVLDIDLGGKDLQQCADAIMRLRAEWQLATGRAETIAFNYTDGGRVPFSRWARGERPSETGRTWHRGARPDAGYDSFRRYLEQVMIYAGTASLAAEMKPVPAEKLETGDVFVHGGFPGHAMLVIDTATNPATGERRFLLAQSYMPAQDIHVVKNPAAADGSPWYGLDFGPELVTPEWRFARTELRRWP